MPATLLIGENPSFPSIVQLQAWGLSWACLGYPRNGLFRAYLTDPKYFLYPSFIYFPT